MPILFYFLVDSRLFSPFLILRCSQGFLRKRLAANLGCEPQTLEIFSRHLPLN